MAVPVIRTVYALRVARVQGPERKLERLPRPRYEDQVNVIAHQAISEDFELVRLSVLVQQAQVGEMISVGKEYAAAPIAALGHVMRDAGQYKAGSSWHPHTLGKGRGDGGPIICRIHGLKGTHPFIVGR